jgi:ABC-2 type transport system permease protein
VNGAIFTRELKSMRVYTLIWVVVLVFSTGANLGGSAGSLSGSAGMDILDAFAQSFLNMMMMAGIFAMILGGLVVSREEDEKTIEFLLGHPVTRIEIALTKFGAFATLVLIFNVVLLAADLVFMEIFKTPAGYDRGALIGLWASGMVLTYLFGAAGMIISVFQTKGGAVVGIGIGVPIVATVLAALGNTGTAMLSVLARLSPYRYLSIPGILQRGGAEPLFILVFAALAVVLVGGTLILYGRREFAN